MFAHSLSLDSASLGENAENGIILKFVRSSIVKMLNRVTRDTLEAVTTFVLTDSVSLEKIVNLDTKTHLLEAIATKILKLLMKIEL